MHRAFNDVLANVELYLVLNRWRIFIDSPANAVIVKASTEEHKTSQDGSRVLPWKRTNGNSNSNRITDWVQQLQKRKEANLYNYA